jgi:hypothetical protein
MEALSDGSALCCNQHGERSGVLLQGHMPCCSPIVPLLFTYLFPSPLVLLSLLLPLGHALAHGARGHPERAAEQGLRRVSPEKHSHTSSTHTHTLPTHTHNHSLHTHIHTPLPLDRNICALAPPPSAASLLCSYSFGIILWEMATAGDTPFLSVPPGLIGHRVAKEGLRPVFPPGTPQDYAELAAACWRADTDSR